MHRITRLGVTRARARSWILLVSLLPTLTFIGHWPAVTVRIPGIDAHVQVPFSGEDEHPEAGQAGAISEGHDPREKPGHGHAQHCHADAASCTDIPFTGTTAFALLNETVAYIGACSLLIALALGLWQPGRSNSIRPEIQPPRPALLPA